MKEIYHFKVTFFMFSSLISRFTERTDLLLKLLSKFDRPYSCCLFFAAVRLMSSWTALISCYNVGDEGTLVINIWLVVCISRNLFKAHCFSSMDEFEVYFWKLMLSLSSFMRLISSWCFSLVFFYSSSLFADNLTPSVITSFKFCLRFCILFFRF